MAASYGYGLVKNHSFIDGNKRTAFQVMFAFLRINGLYLDAPEPEVVITMQRLAQGEIERGSPPSLARHGQVSFGETELSEWLAKFSS